MRGTLIIHAHPDTMQLMADEMRRFAGTRTGIRDRLYAAWLVFCGRADALCWEDWENRQQ